ncbi:hypothetical protein FJZ31_01595 [Candidatus Poribacteria bacterium]|nr:hypothetical protein [Candidatus Poribacteria bacterium]
MKIKILLLITCLTNMIFLSNQVLAAFVDDFNSPNLDQKVWDLKTAGKASYEIKGGTFKIESPAVESGAILYHPRNLQNEDITFEIKVNVSELGDNISMGFIAAPLEPQINEEINKNLEATFYFVPANWYIKQDPVVIGEKPPNPVGMEGQYKKADWNVVQIDFSKSNGKITFYINGKEAGQVDSNKDVQTFLLERKV